MKKIFSLNFIICFVFFLYSFIQSCCMIYVGDDHWWFSIKSLSILFGEDSQNGRYLTNFFTYIIIHNSVFRVIFCTVFLFGLFFLMSHTISRNKEDRLKAYLVSAFTFLSVPPLFACYTIKWMSGITNYVFSVCLTLVYVLFCKPLLSGRNIKAHKLWCIPMFLFAFVSVFTVENVAIYNLVFSIFIIIFVRFRKLKIHPANISYSIGSAVGLLVMLMNRNYSSIILKDNDTQGVRFVNFDFTDIIFKIYSIIIVSYSKPFYIVNIIVAVSFLLLYYKRKNSSKDNRNLKYAKYCMACIMMYAMYSFCTSVFSNLVSLTIALRLNAFETAFTFLYLLSLIYMAYFCLEKNCFIRFTLWLLSTVILVIPLTVVSPVSARCFYPTFVFWCIAAGEIFIEVTLNIRFSEIVGRTFAAVLCFLCSFFSFMNIENKIVDNVRRDYFVEQISEKNRLIEVIDLPYTTYQFDDMYRLIDYDYKGIVDEYVDYKELYFCELGLDPVNKENDKRVYIDISTVDYFK